MVTPIPESIWQGHFRLFGVNIRCHVLADGNRIIDAESLFELFEAMNNPAVKMNQFELESFARWSKDGD